jgi:hypothetical protein
MTERRARTTILRMSTTAVASSRTRRLAPRTRKLLLIVHIAASVALLGTCASIVLTSLTAALSDDDTLAHSAYELLGNSRFLGIPFTFLSLITGVLLAVLGRWGLFRYRWTAIKLLALLGVLLLGAVPQNLVLDPLIESATPTVEGTRWLVPVIAGAQIALLLLATSLSVIKPSTRIRPR